MPIRRSPDSELEYLLLCFDADGRERTHDPDGMLSQRVLSTLERVELPVTDVFVVSLGWCRDPSTAVERYDRWLLAMECCPRDFARARARRGRFQPLIVGLHWPSEPWSEREMRTSDESLSLEPALPLVAMVDAYASRLRDSSVTRRALRVVLAAAEEEPAPQTLPDDVVDAYRALDAEAGLGTGGVAGEPGSDREPFDPELSYQEARDALDDPVDGLDGFAGLLEPLRLLTFSKMKDRARRIGEQAAHALVGQMMIRARRDVRFHAIGHGFGGILVSAMACGSRAAAPLPRALDSLTIAQGAMSLWSFAPELPGMNGRPGHFHRLLSERRVSGPILATHSEHDRAMALHYPLAAGLRGQMMSRADHLPRYGAMGFHGIQGAGLPIEALDMRPLGADYTFAPGHIYNLDATEVVREGAGPLGAHRDLAQPEVAHAFWSAALTEPEMATSR